MLVGAVVLGVFVHPFVGSGQRCEGIGFGCTPERDLDTLLIVAVCATTSLGTVLAAWRRARRGRPWSRALAAGIAITVLATAATVWSQLPRHQFSPGALSAARDRWALVLADGRAAAPAGTPLGDVLRSLQRRGPLTCRDAYGRSTGARALHWSNRGATDAYTGSSDSVGRGHRRRPPTVGRPPAPAWRGRDAFRSGWRPHFRPPPSGRPLRHGSNGVLYVRASFYIAKLEIAAATGCHRD